MAFADPQSVTVNSVAKSMPRTSTSAGESVYEMSDGSYKLTISHQKLKGGRVRSLARLDRRDVVADPLTAVNDYETLTFYCVIDRPEAGFSSTVVSQVIAGFVAWLDSTVQGKLYGRET